MQIIFCIAKITCWLWQERSHFIQGYQTFQLIFVNKIYVLSNLVCIFWNNIWQPWWVMIRNTWIEITNIFCTLCFFKYQYFSSKQYFQKNVFFHWIWCRFRNFTNKKTMYRVTQNSMQIWILAILNWTFEHYHKVLWEIMGGKMKFLKSLRKSYSTTLSKGT